MRTLISQVQILKRWDSLPDNIREALVSLENADALGRICEIEHISKEKKRVVSKITSHALLGFIHPEDIGSQITEELGIDKKIGASISDAVQKRILAPLKPDLEKIYAPVEEEPASLPPTPLPTIVKTATTPPAPPAGLASIPMPPPPPKRSEGFAAGPELNRREPVEGSAPKILQKQSEVQPIKQKAGFFSSLSGKLFQGTTQKGEIGRVASPQFSGVARITLGKTPDATQIELLSHDKPKASMPPSPSQPSPQNVGGQAPTPRVVHYGQLNSPTPKRSEGPAVGPELNRRELVEGQNAPVPLHELLARAVPFPANPPTSGSGENRGGQTKTIPNVPNMPPRPPVMPTTIASPTTPTTPTAPPRPSTPTTIPPGSSTTPRTATTITSFATLKVPPPLSTPPTTPKTVITPQQVPTWKPTPVAIQPQSAGPQTPNITTIPTNSQAASRSSMNINVPKPPMPSQVSVGNGEGQTAPKQFAPSGIPIPTSPSQVLPQNVGGQAPPVPPKTSF